MKANRKSAVIIASVIKQYDAISNAVLNSFRILDSIGDWDVSLISLHNEFSEFPVQVVKGVGDLLLNQSFLDADLLIYHFGIYNPLLDALLVGNNQAKQVVRFHNITPAHLLRAEIAPIIDRSFVQLHNLRRAEFIWADSETNAEVLIHNGIDQRVIEIIPLAVDRPRSHSLAEKLDETINIIFVGRAVSSKGLLDCLDVVNQICKRGLSIRLTVICNVALSDESYLAECEKFVQDNGLSKIVSIYRSPGEDLLEKHYQESHVFLIPSYHEGFCVPVVESLRAGCIPIAYASGNLEAIVNGLGRVVPTGDRAALASALYEVVEGLGNAARGTIDVAIPLDCGHLALDEFDRAAKKYVENFTFDRISEMHRSSIERIFTTGGVCNVGSHDEIHSEGGIENDGSDVDLIRRMRT